MDLNQYPKGLLNVISSQIFQEICIKSKDIVSLPLFSQKNGVFEVGLSPSKKNCIICFIESPLKMMENAFYFIVKALFVLKIFNFLS